jgi:transposase-like protein
MGKRRKFNAEFKAEVVLALLSGEKTSAELCREHGITSQALGNWKQQFIANASRAFDGGSSENGEDKRVAELERMVGKLAIQLEITKKASTILKSGRERGEW